MDSMHAKLAWSAIQGTGLWSQFMWAKYAVNFGFGDPPIAPRMWKVLMNQIPKVLECSRWIVGDGSVSLWAENWSGVVLDGPRPVDVSLSVRDALPILDQLLLLVPSSQHDNIWRMQLQPQLSDRLMCTLTKSEALTIKYFWEDIHLRQPKIAWASKIWHPWIPKKVSGLVWKLLNNALPIDT